MHILILDRNPERRTELACGLRACLAGGSIHIDGLAQQSVFACRPDTDYDAVFLWVDGMPDLEAARQLTRVFPGLPLVLVSDSGEFAMEGYHLQARYYLRYPANRPILTDALGRCGLLDAHSVIKQEEDL